MIERIVQALESFFQSTFNLDLSNQFLLNLLSSIIIILALWLVRWFVLRFIHHRFAGNARSLYTWRKTVEYAFVALGVILVGRLWLAGFGTVATYLGLLSAGLAIALQDLIIALAGWLFIIWRRPFVVGDRIEIAGQLGDVIDIRIFSFSMLEIGQRIQAEQSTGRIIHVPNGKVFSEMLTNMHQGLPFIWNEIPVLVTFESDWEKAKEILLKIVDSKAPDVVEAMKRYGRRPGHRFVISVDNVLPTVYTSVADSGVLLTMRYMIDPRKRRNSEQEIWETILRAFKQHWDIDFAYPTERKYDFYLEGRPKADVPAAETAVDESSGSPQDIGNRPTTPKEPKE